VQCPASGTDAASTSDADVADASTFSDVRDDDAASCPADAPSACIDCASDVFCVAGPCPIISCPQPEAGVVDAALADAVVDAADAHTICPADSPPIAAIPSVGNVTFMVTNTSHSDRYVVTQAFGCELFSIGGQTLSLPFSCPCECSAPQPTFDLQLVAAGSSVSVVWDGRGALSYTTYQSCAAFGAPARCGAVQNVSPQPVAAGMLTVTLDYVTMAPSTFGGTTCSASGQGLRCSGTPAFVQQRCLAQGVLGVQAVSATFELPASGGVVVPVSIP
jgi:hypothetical protein